MFTGPHQMSFSDAGCFDDALVLRRAAGLCARVGDERAVLRDAGVLFVPDRMLVERAGREVAMDRRNGEAVAGKIERWGCHQFHPGEPAVPVNGDYFLVAATLSGGGVFEAWGSFCGWPSTTGWGMRTRSHVCVCALPK